MTDTHHKANPLASAPCLLGQEDNAAMPAATSPESLVLLNSLSRVFGLRLTDDPQNLNNRFLAEVADLFSKSAMDAETVLEKHERPWRQVYLVQHGVLRLFRESPAGKVAIHHFFTEGDMIWPVFGRSRTARNTLCLTPVTPCTLWVADFSTFRSTIRSYSEGRWARFALALTEELAELSTMREFHKQTLPAQDRYDMLVQDYPELIRRVPDFLLAAWLGVAPATFSRLKHKD
ncbi:Crp/Fnr family transcriptional regulator [Marinobacter caseinilyticus]|uniref:Crp/Fnr family transcriptional regulator n=1 Tax=Marinobacter caseinilyticus TaxID=2692195 RepID=UPI00140834F3|nr:Crp/Fnr family transcriptional regulator [Marinobacter caseinilyticus]